MSLLVLYFFVLWWWKCILRSIDRMERLWFIENVFLTCHCMMSHTTFRMLMHPLHAVIFLLFDILPFSANPRLIFWSLENLPRLNAQWCFLLSAQLLHTYLLRQALKTRVSSRPHLPKVHLKDTSQGSETSPPLTIISYSVMFSFGCATPTTLAKGLTKPNVISYLAT